MRLMLHYDPSIDGKASTPEDPPIIYHAICGFLLQSVGINVDWSDIHLIEWDKQKENNDE